MRLGFWLMADRAKRYGDASSLSRRWTFDQNGARGADRRCSSPNLGRAVTDSYTDGTACAAALHASGPPSNALLSALASGNACQPDTLKRCAICGFVVDVKFAAEKPTVR